MDIDRDKQQGCWAAHTEVEQRPKESEPQGHFQPHSSVESVLTDEFGGD